MAAAASVDLVDPFDLPEWLGVAPVTWTGTTSLAGAHHVSGVLAGGPAGEGELRCDLLACDLAYPVPVLSEPWRHDAHQAWQLGQVLLVSYNGELTLAVPGTQFSADTVLEVVARLALALGAPPASFTVALRL